MAANRILNATPFNYKLGTDDRTDEVIYPEPIPVPQFLAKIFIFAKKGPTDPTMTVGGHRSELYGSETFRANSPYFNHATNMANLINSVGTTQMIQRVIPTDANQPSNFRLYIEYVVDAVPFYKRNGVVYNTGGTPIDYTGDGTVQLDVNGNPIPETLHDPATGNDLATPMLVNGLRYRFVKQVDPTDFDYGQATVISSGSMVSVGGNVIDPVTGATSTVNAGDPSTLIPFMEVKAASRGAYGNDNGIQLAPGYNNDAPKDYITDAGFYPFYVTNVERPDANTTPAPVKSTFGEATVQVAFKPNALDPYNGAQMAFDARFPDLWENDSNPNVPLAYSNFDNSYVYYDNLDTFLQLFLSMETPAILPTNYMAFDWGTSVASEIVADGQYKTNFIGGRSSSKNNYFTMVRDTSGAATPAGMVEISIGNGVNILMEGGSDGTMDDTMFNALVTTEMARYLDHNDSVMNTALNKESVFLDSGFPMATKIELINAIALRKDTYVFVSTYDPGNPLTNGGTKPMDINTEYNNAIALNTAMANFPESTYFNTGVMRGLIIGQSAKLVNSLYHKRVSNLYEFAKMAAKLMGAANGAWDSAQMFDFFPGNVVTGLKDIQPRVIPADTRYALWGVNMIYTEPYDRDLDIFTSQQTVYSNDQSVLNSFYTTFVIAMLEKFSDEVWLEYTGAVSLTKAQLRDRVIKAMYQKTDGKFGGIFDFQFDVVYTQADLNRGYSWTLICRIGSPMMHTVMTTQIEAYDKGSIPNI